MHIHILGICGTFMGGIAALAKAAGHRVTGADENVYPPMSTQLEALGIDITTGYDPIQLKPAPDCVVIGNIMTRGNPVIEALLDQGLSYLSGPEWLSRHILADRWVLAVAGTHGKTTVSSMLAHILEQAGLKPGFLIGGVPKDFGVSARLGESPFFVVEADEYDTAFFDKRSKFVHYHPRTLVINNLEYDHADIFPDMTAIERQFHHLIRTIPAIGRVIAPVGNPSIDIVLGMGCWTPVERLADPDGWQAEYQDEAGGQFKVLNLGKFVGEVDWGLIGQHNVMNGLAAIAAARHVGVIPDQACRALSGFQGVKRRLELKGQKGGIKVYDDFAHHPTAIATTLAGMRQHDKAGRIIAVIEPRSNTMKLGIHRDALPAALKEADKVYLLAKEALDWISDDLFAPAGIQVMTVRGAGALLDVMLPELCKGDQVVIMSNGGADGLHEKLLHALPG